MSLKNMRSKLTILSLGLILIVFSAPACAAASDFLTSSEVTAAMKPYQDGYKLAGIIAIIADKTGKVHYKLRNGMFGHDGALGTDLSVHPKTGMVAVFMVQCTSGDQWAARDLFLKTATLVIPKMNGALIVTEMGRHQDIA
jgi:hypothetical protein